MLSPQQQLPPASAAAGNVEKADLNTQSLTSDKLPMVVLDESAAGKTTGVAAPTTAPRPNVTAAPSTRASASPAPVANNTSGAAKDSDIVTDEEMIFEPPTHDFLPVHSSIAGKQKKIIGDYTSQSERKKLREKKRRQEISVAIERLSRMLLKLDPTSFMQHNNQLYHFSEAPGNKKRKAGNESDAFPSIPTRQVQHHPLNRTDTINHAVVMLEKLARESEESKIELLQAQHSMMVANKQPQPTVTTSAFPQQFTTSAAAPMQQTAAHNLVSPGHQQVIVGNNQQIITEMPLSNGLVMSMAPTSNILLSGPSNYITYAQHPQPEPQHEQKLFLQQYQNIQQQQQYHQQQPQSSS